MEIINAILLVCLICGVLGTIGAAVLGAVAAWLTHGMKTGRGEIIWTVVTFSYACAGWACMVVVGNGLFNQDPFTLLPNGYAIRMDDGDDNLLLNPKTQWDGRYGTAEMPDTATNVSKLQLAGRYMLGSANHVGEPPGGEKHRLIYFMLDTSTRHYATFTDAGALSRAAWMKGIHVELEPLDAVYSRYAFNLLNYPLMPLALVPPAAVALYGLIWILRRRERPASI